MVAVVQRQQRTVPVNTGGVVFMILVAIFVAGANGFQIGTLGSSSQLLAAVPRRQRFARNGASLTKSSSSTALFHQFNPLRINEDSTPKEVAKPTVGGFDFGAVFKYLTSMVVQMSLFYALFQGLDRFVLPNFKVPFALNAVAMYFLALKSRIFNPLSNRRPQPKTKEVNGAQQRKMPSWTPPGFVFPIVWLLLIGPLRAVTSAMVIHASGQYTTPALLSLMLHLSIGDVWNTINNVERRYGTSVLGIFFVWTSAANAAFQYYKVLPVAGKALSLKLIWLTIASSLIFRTWQLNPDPSTGQKSPLLPTRGDGYTKFTWFS